MTTALREASFPALGTTAVVRTVADDALSAAVEVVRAELAVIDQACSRFRPDSDLAAVNRAQGRPVLVSLALLDAVDLALDAARITDGLVDPTIGTALRLLGYDRDFAAVERTGGPVVRVGRVPGWKAVTVDRGGRTITVPAGVELDLGATAKALAADRAADAAARAVDSGVLVSLGGDIAVAGHPPVDGWPVYVTDWHLADLETDRAGEHVVVWSGGLASSSTTARTWLRGTAAVHHIVDPATGRSVESPWRTVAVAAASCAHANIASTAAIVMGAAAPSWLASFDLPARLVALDGTVTHVGDWPEVTS